VEKSKTTVLLVGESPQGSSYLARTLERQGCACLFAASYQEACRVLRGGAIDLVLSQMRLRDQTLYPLINLLDGTRTTLFYWQPVEDGCWWLPAMRRGQECFGVAALHPSEFTEQLEAILKELRTEAAAIEKSPQTRVPAPPGPVVLLRASRREPPSVGVARDMDLLAHKAAS
jgi:CheY-like chemotaxis protein